ncbi:uncharacterized protein LOC126588521 [Malus sylvestris]|uniref:uncharacterized protein LOC126588521 n=1 Tax=Malus sylvestris TaxID=3752 RepID=UPI0021ABB54E|nr:uncharacterized protein LOC126588521 [Malus sylvestris]XP_050109580.1 uncharacterized protein LOC126588521 [Malus sylvestris]
MESARIARCKYRSLTVVIALSENSKYVDIYNEICLRFKELKVGSFELTYSLPEHPNCLLQSDMDVNMMLLCLKVLKSNFIDILVKDLLSSNNEDDDQNQEESHHAASNHTISNNEVSNRTAPFSCTLENQSAIDENELLRVEGDKRFLPQDWKEYISHVGQRFEGGVTEFRNKLIKYAAQMRFRLVYAKNDKERITAECFKKISDGCKWRIHASLCGGNGFFYIRSLNNVHTCTSDYEKQKTRSMGSKVISSVLMDQIREKPMIKPTDIVKDFKQKYGLDISYHSARRGKELAKSEVHGDETLSYNQLLWYKDTLMSTNRGSHCVLECDLQTSRFQRLFICYGACIEGFQWCRPLLFMDATSFKSKYKGQLIGATGKDGNQGFFPFAFAIVASESEENWSWFFENLAKVLTPQGRTITFVSNHDRGVAGNVSSIFPTSHHAFCLNDMKQNLTSWYPATYSKFFQDRIVDLFMECVSAPTEAAFEINMKNLRDEGGAPVKTFLENFPKENWSCAYFKGNRYSEMYSTVSELFQSWTLELSVLPICQMVDRIRIKLMGMMSERSCEAEQCSSILCPEMEKTLNEMLIVGRHWNAIRSCGSVFEVLAEGSFTVDLDNRFCSCHEWQMKGFPCAHALVAVRKNSGYVYNYIDDYFKVSHYRSSYASHISPLPDIKDAVHEGSEDMVVLPPLTRQPKKNKRKSVEKVTRPIKCGRCGAVGGHNKKTCTAII